MQLSSYGFMPNPFVSLLHKAHAKVSQPSKTPCYASCRPCVELRRSSRLVLLLERDTVTRLLAAIGLRARLVDLVALRLLDGRGALDDIIVEIGANAATSGRTDDALVGLARSMLSTDSVGLNGLCWSVLLACFLGADGDAALLAGCSLETNRVAVDEAGVLAGLLVDEIEGIAREYCAAASLALDLERVPRLDDHPKDVWGHVGAHGVGWLSFASFEEFV